MMNQHNSINHFEVKYSRMGSPVAVVKGVHLHSIYDPAREAENFIDSQVKNLKGKIDVVILGLGFGYHVKALQHYFDSIKSDYNIIVIEPNQDVYNYVAEKNLVDFNKVKVINSHSIDELYSNEKLVHFLLQKPAIIAHPASFNHYHAFFKEFLTYNAPTNIGNLKRLAQTTEIKNYLDTLDPNLDIESYLGLVDLKTEHAEMDYLMMALGEIINTNKNQAL